MQLRLVGNNHFLQIVNCNDEEYECLKTITTTEKWKFVGKTKKKIVKKFMNMSLLPSGLWHKILSLHKQFSISIDGLQNIVDISINEETIQNYIDSIELKNSIEPRWYQLNAVVNAAKFKISRGNFATGAGKTLICYLVARYYIENIIKNSGKILMVVPSTQLVIQTYNEWLNEYQADNAVSIDIISESFSNMRNSQGNVIITNIDTIRTFPKEFFKNIKGLIFDEAHKLTTKTYQLILSNCAQNELSFVYSVSGSWYEKNSPDDIECEALSGPITCEVSTSELIEQGSLTPIEITEVQLLHTDDDAYIYYNSDDCQITEYKNKRMHFELELIRNNQKRFEVITNVVSAIKDANQLLLFKSVEYAEKFYTYLKNVCENREIHIITGSVGQNDREQIKSITENQHNVIICATYGTMSTGINIKNLSTLHFIEPPKSFIWVRQSIGRTLRLHPSKKIAMCISYVDIFKKINSDWLGPDRNIMYKHMKHRINIYKQQNFPYKVTKLIQL